MEAALQWTYTYANSVQTSILIFMDSQSLCEALSSYNPQTTYNCQCISFISSSIFIKWILRQSNIPGNDLADRAAKEATTIQSVSIHPTPLSCAFQVTNKLFCDSPPLYGSTSKIYQHCKTSTDLQKIKSCSNDVLIARFFSEHHLLLKAHHHQIDPEIDPLCRSCQ